jgi:hypothetical protein
MVDLDGIGKFLLPQGFDPRTVQPVASRYNNWAIPAHEERVRRKLYLIFERMFCVVGLMEGVGGRTVGWRV